MLVLILVIFSAQSALALENLREHRVTKLNQHDVAGFVDVVFSGNRLIVAHTETERSSNLRLTFFDLYGWKQEIRDFRGDSRWSPPASIRGSSDGTGASFVWIEEDSFGVPRLYCLTTTDTQTFRLRQVDSGMYMSKPEVQIYGTNVHVIYRIRNSVYEKVSTDGGETFSARIPVLEGGDPEDLPYAFDLNISSTGRLGLVVSVLERSVDSQGNVAYRRKVHYFEKASGSVSPFGSPTLIYGSTGDADAPPESAIFPVLSLAFDNSGNPWVAWISRNADQPKVMWRTRTGSVWGALNSFPHQNNLSSSLRLVRNASFNNPGVVFFYTKGSGSGVFYRYSLSSSNLSAEKNVASISEAVLGYMDAEAVSSGFAVLTLSPFDGSLSTLKLWYEDLIEQGRSFKKRFKLFSQGFESSDVLNDPCCQVVDDSGAGCYFKETTRRFYSGQKSLWSAGVGSVNGNYRPNTNTTMYLNFGGLPGLSYELRYRYLFHRSGDPGDTASGGFSGNLLTLPETNFTWVRASVFGSGESGRIVFKMIADSNSICGEGLFVDDVTVHGYTVPRPSIQVVGATQSSVRIAVSNFTPGRVSLFRAPYGSDEFFLVAESTSSEVVDNPPHPGDYTYFAVADDGRFESPPSEPKTFRWSGLVPVFDRFVRIGGADRYLTAVELSKSTFSSAENVVIATGANFPDALSAAPLAAVLRGPILLTRADALPSAVEQEIMRLGARKAWIVGGTGVVSEAVRERLNFLGLETERIGGKDRYETSCLIAEKIIALQGSSRLDLVYVATGENYPDALSVSPLAASSAVPVLLVRKDVLPARVADLLNRIEVRNAVIVGGEGAVSRAVESQLPNSKRISGVNRYSTSVEIARFAYMQTAFGRRTVYIATGENFPDALAAGVCAAAEGSVLLLVKTGLPLWHETETFLEHMKIYNLVKVVGLEGAVSQDTEVRISQLIR